MSKGLRVLIIRNAYQQDAGGAEQYALNLAIALKNAGHKPVLVTKVKKILAKAQDNNIRVISGRWHDTQRWDRWYYLRYPLFTLWYMYVILRHQVDIVHAQSRDDFVFATRAASLLSKPVIWTDHADLKYILDSVNHYNPRMRGWVINASKKANAIVCASQSEKQSIRSVAPKLPELQVVHNGVFLPSGVKPVAKPDKLVVGTNARLVPAKGIAELLEGFAKSKDKKTVLWLLGGTSGNEKKYQQLAKRLGIERKVKIWGYVDSPNNVVAAMDIFVHASYHEAFSLAIIEAAMLGRPIIATNVGGTPEIIDASSGILIEPKNASAITQAINFMVDHPDKRDKLAEAVRRKVARNFNFQKIVEEKIIPLYLKAIST